MGKTIDLLVRQDVVCTKGVIVGSKMLVIKNFPLEYQADAKVEVTQSMLMNAVAVILRQEEVLLFSTLF